MNYCKNTYFFNTNFVKIMIVKNCLKRFWDSKEKPTENSGSMDFFQDKFKLYSSKKVSNTGMNFKTRFTNLKNQSVAS